MFKFIAGFVVLVAVVAVIYMGSDEGGSDVSISETPMVARSPEDVPRTEQGLRLDAIQVTAQIWPWDNSMAQRWMDEEIARLDPLVTEPTHRALLNDLTIRTADSNGASRGLTYVPTPTGLELLFDGTPKEQDAGKLILLEMAKAGDAFAYYNLAIWELDYGTFPQSFGRDLFREAADREFLPAIVNFAPMAKNVWDISEDEIAAYLHFGLDLGASDGAYYNALNIVSFYVDDHRNRSSGGYLDRALQVISDNGGALFAAETQAYRLFNAIDMETTEFLDDDLAEVLNFDNSVPIAMPDVDGAIEAYKKSITLGGTKALKELGSIYGEDVYVPLDRDLARDYLVACLIHAPEPNCVLMLGNLYWAYDVLEAPTAYAFYAYGLEIMEGSQSSFNGLLSRTEAAMSPDELATAQSYLEQIRRGDFSQIPHVKDARPVIP